MLDVQLTLFMKTLIEKEADNEELLDELMEDYNISCQNLSYQSIIHHLYIHNIDLAPGKKAPNFRAWDATEEKISLSSFRGKNVLLIFWTPGSIPCIPCNYPMDRLMNTYKDSSDLVFLYVAFHDLMNHWKRFITDRMLKGVHLFVDPEQAKLIYQTYCPDTIPFYYLIGTKGQIIQSNIENLEKVEELLR